VPGPPVHPAVHSQEDVMRTVIPGNRAAIALIVGLTLAAWLGVNRAAHEPPADDAGPPIRPGATAALSTSRADLSRTILQMEERLKARLTDREAAILLAEASMRQARVTGNSGLNQRAAQALEAVVADEPMDYEARRMLATVYAAAHRFRDAILEAQRARTQQPRDPWIEGVLGDSFVELGEYDDAFAAFERMLAARPSAGAYSRVSYALELQGKLDDAARAMRLAADAANPRDPESVAWFHAQLGNLYMDLDRLPDATAAYAFAERAFPGHPFARAGIARLRAAEGDSAGAIAILREELDKLGTPDVAIALGDLYASLGNAPESEQMYDRAEARLRAGGSAEQDHLARFLADHDRHIGEAVRLAESSAAQDILGQDTLAWVYFKAGRPSEADRAAVQAMRTGTRHLEILYHAAAIRHALGDDARAREILDRAPKATGRFARTAAAAQRLRALIDARQVAAIR
jgi:tetratricopeptide (TPR) repeat protein